MEMVLPQLCVAVSAAKAGVVINLLVGHQSLQGVHSLHAHHTALTWRQTELLHTHTQIYTRHSHIVQCFSCVSKGTKEKQHRRFEVYICSDNLQMESSLVWVRL